MLITKSFVSFDDPEMFTQEQVDKKMADAKGDLFNQEDVNTFLATEKRKTQEAQKALESKLQDAKKVANVTKEQKTELDKQIEDLQKKYMTVDERSRQAADKASKKHGLEITDLKENQKAWQNRYTNSVISHAIVTSAAANKAYDASQIEAILRPKCKIVEKTDSDGQPTGAYEPRIDFEDTDKDGEPVTLDITISEAVKRMTELTQHGNLFEGGKSSGMGGSGGTRSKNVDIAKIAKVNVREYRRLRKERPELFASM